MKFVCGSSAELVVRVVTLASRFGYFHVVRGRIPKHKDPQRVDRKLMVKYGVERDRMKAMRRHRQGIAKVKYLRWRDLFLLLATDGESPLFQEERPVDLRKNPVRIGDRLTAAATEISLRGRSGIYDIRITNQDGVHVAEFRGHSRSVNGTHLPVTA